MGSVFMLVGQFVRKALPVIYTTSDAGAKHLYEYLQVTGYGDSHLDNVMAEYICLKLAIALEEICKACANQQQYDDVYMTLMSEFESTMNKMPSSMNYGLIGLTLMYGKDKYIYKSTAQKAKTFYYETILIPESVAKDVCAMARQDIVQAFTRISQGQSATPGGCGCSSAIACMVLLAAMIVCIIAL